ncbi:hypothetical protein Poli38472_009115 [Pythium oligandrum]|uniref:Uncharacterized protein n=1 Tax=Pythium oligandrum TaxID=41045 RepID=A0A8K1FNT2_PYTOL|nr:hypothetical protein Poli38472_009115 [Pythium oligandrum]|eukprot:TMW64948.1 hypothetical protein Poli38472_009115 [Pythium oligandrum]
MSATIATAFETTLVSQGTAKTPHDLVSKYPSSKTPVTPVTLEQCEFFGDFMADPEQVTAMIKRAREEAELKYGKKYVRDIMWSNKHHELKKHRQYDFRLQPHELERLAKQGFAVSTRLQTKSFADLYYHLYTDDLPVYVTADSILHAWHRSFDAFLMGLEEEELMPHLRETLDNTIKACQTLFVDPAVGLFQETGSVLANVELFLRVARALLDQPSEESAHSPPFASIVSNIMSERTTTIELFGSRRNVDFSLFKPRGHYTKSEKLQQYFRAMSWLGTVDFRVGNGEDPAVDRFQLQCAVVLVHCLRAANEMSRVQRMADIIGMIAGDGAGADSMTPTQLESLLSATQDKDLLSTYLGSGSEQALTSLQTAIATSGFAAQAISGHPHAESDPSPNSPTTTLPLSFTFMGQQFVWSAFVFSKLTYDQVRHEQTKVIRRLPSAVDVAFAMLGNDGASEEIARRMALTSVDKDFVKFRDGVPYTSNLLALRSVLDKELSSVDVKNASLGTLWVLALRELSKPSATSASVFQSKEWQLRQMNAQLASFTQLRHDTILYAKQSATFGTLCDYPAGYVDPYPSFWGMMQNLAERCAQICESLTVLGEITDTNAEKSWYHITARSKASRLFPRFAETMNTLKEIAEAQAAHRSLTEDQEDFVKTVMEERFGSGGSHFLGWYPSLFYRSPEDSAKQDHLVADVHTDTPSVEHGDADGVLHLGVGNVHCGFFVVNGIM